MRRVRGAFEDCESFAVSAEARGKGNGVEFEGLDEGLQPDFIRLDCSGWEIVSEWGYEREEEEKL